MDRDWDLGVLAGAWCTFSASADPPTRSGLACLSPLPCIDSYRALAKAIGASVESTMNSSVAKPFARLIPGSAVRGAVDSIYLSHNFHSATMHLS